MDLAWFIAPKSGVQIIFISFSTKLLPQYSSQTKKLSNEDNSKCDIHQYIVNKYLLLWITIMNLEFIKMSMIIRNLTDGCRLKRVTKNQLILFLFCLAQLTWVVVCILNIFLLPAPDTEPLPNSGPPQQMDSNISSSIYYQHLFWALINKCICKEYFIRVSISIISIITFDTVVYYVFFYF